MILGYPKTQQIAIFENWFFPSLGFWLIFWVREEVLFFSSTCWQNPWGFHQTAGVSFFVSQLSKSNVQNPDMTFHKILIGSGSGILISWLIIMGCPWYLVYGL